MQIRINNANTHTHIPIYLTYITYMVNIGIQINMVYLHQDQCEFVVCVCVLNVWRLFVSSEIIKWWTFTGSFRIRNIHEHEHWMDRIGIKTVGWPMSICRCLKTFSSLWYDSNWQWWRCVQGNDMRWFNLIKSIAHLRIVYSIDFHLTFWFMVISLSATFLGFNASTPCQIYVNRFLHFSK